MTATYPIEYVCFYPVEVPTREGDAYVFVASDLYSKFIFTTGVESDRDTLSILKHIRLLTKHKEFVSKLPVPFTIVLHKYEELREEIMQILEPLGGQMIVDEMLILKELTPVIEHIYKSMSESK